MKALLILIFTFSSISVYSQTINYYTHIQPILQLHCMPCHAKNNIGTMPLTNYKEVTAYAKMIEYVTENKLMPPWKAENETLHFKNAKKVNSQEIAVFKKWIDSGMIKGKPALRTTPPKTYNTSISKPSLTIAMQQPFVQKGDFIERTQAFVIPVSLKKEEFVEAIEFIAGNKKIVKSCNISIDTGTKAMLYDSYDLDYGYSSPNGLSFIPYQYIWYQWTADIKGSTTYATPYLKKLPAKSNMILHITYAASTSVQRDSSYVKIKFGKKDDSSKIINTTILFNNLNITNGSFVINVDEKRRFYATATLTHPIEIHSIMPMGQNACNTWEIYAIDSLTGIKTEILNIPQWDAHWRKKYDFTTPIHLTKTSKIYGTAYYNNSEENTNLIILPPKKINYGEGDRDELFLVQYDIVEMQNEEQ